MRNIQYTTIDKRGWPRGEWDNEPDKWQYMDDETGFPCLIVRNDFGALCGYVGVSQSHPFFKKDRTKLSDKGLHSHKGISFTDHCQVYPDAEMTGICHKVEPGENDNVWWIGFDCAHLGTDIIPMMMHSFEWIMHKPEYRNIAYVKDTVSLLAKQLAACAKKRAFRKVQR